jgi:hypothetical protein
MKRLSAREQKRKDDLAKAAESIRNMNRMRDMEVRPSRLPADDDYEGANGDAMREEALEMMNRGNLMADVEEPELPMNRRPARGGLRSPSGKIRGSMAAR